VQRGDLWDEVLLPPDVGLGRKAVVYCAKKRSWQLPEVLGQKEVERLLLATTKQRDRCLLMTAYATGLRVSELVRLKISAIDSERMDGASGTRQGKKRPLHRFVATTVDRAALVLEGAPFADLPIPQPKGRPDIDEFEPEAHRDEYREKDRKSQSRRRVQRPDH
jgi:integrase